MHRLLPLPVDIFRFKTFESNKVDNLRLKDTILLAKSGYCPDSPAQGRRLRGLIFDCHYWVRRRLCLNMPHSLLIS